jgi:hypothetical protein
MLRKIFIVFAILLLFFAVAIAYLYHKIQPIIRSAEARQKVLQPGSIKGEGRFKRRTFYTGEGLGIVSQITVGWPADREGADIAVVGDQGADFLDLAGSVKKKVRFSIAQRCPITLARVDATGEYGYLTRDESWAAPATLFDKEGQVSWRSKGWSGIDDSVPGNVTGDGKLSIVIGLNGGEGIVLLDGQGNELWKKEEGNVWHVETLDTNGDGREEILHSNAMGQLIVRSGKGDVIARYLPNFYVSQFAITRWGDEDRASHILVPITKSGEGKSAYILLDANGKEVIELESPLGESFTRLSSIPIRFGNGVEYFAVLGNDSSADRSMLLLYGEEGQIAYQEILGESCLGIATLPQKQGERLLVGCNARVWEYSPVNQTKPRSTPETPKGH